MLLLLDGNELIFIDYYITTRRPLRFQKNWTLKKIVTSTIIHKDGCTSKIVI